MNAVYIALPFVQFALSLFLANIVVASDPSNRVNRLFTFFLLAMAVWGIAIFGMRDAFPDEPTAFAREKIALAAIPVSSVLFFHFVLRFTKGPPLRWTLVGLYAFVTLSGVLAMTNQVATGMVPKFYGFAPELGWGFLLLLLATYPPVIAAFVRLSRVARREQNSRARRQVKLLRFGIAAMILGGTSDFIPSLGLDIYPMGIVGNLFFVALATWGVTRYRMMELRLVLRRGLAYSAVSSFLFAVYGASFGAVFFLARGLTTPAFIMTIVGAIVIVGVVVQPLMARVQGMVDRAFFRERLDRVAGLARLNELTKDITNFSAVAHGITETVRRTVQADWVAITLPQEKRKAYVSIADTRETPAELEMMSDGAVISWLKENQAIIRVSEFRSEEMRASTPIEDFEPLMTAGAYLLVPMVVGDRLSGVMALGGKLAGADYNSEDRSFLQAAADHASIAVENARLYANVRNEATEREAVAELARVVGSTLEMNDVMARCSHQVRTLLRADRVEIVMLSDDGSHARLAHVDGNSVPGWEQGTSVPVMDSPSGAVAERQQGAVIDLGSLRLAASPSARSAAEAGLLSMVAVPLVSKGKTIGILNVQSCDPEAYGPEELQLATRIGAQVTNAVANSLLYEQALQLAEEREARARLDAENRELQRINEAKIAFLSTVSHELRTPLTSMMAFADIMRRNKLGNLNERDLGHIDVIKRNGRRLTLLIGDLLDVSRIESGSLKLEMSEFDTRALVEEINESFLPLLDRKHQKLKLVMPEKEVSAHADRDRIAQVVSNLVSNALKYSGENTTITVTMRYDDERVYLDVADQGIGISEEDQKQLFTSFFRADNDATRAEAGTGLGLVIVKGIVEMHRGTIRVASKLGEGTTVHVEFARRAASSGEVEDAA